jgi:hypothetical protein
MKTYIIKPEYLNLYGSDANPMTTLSENDITNFAEEWNIDEYDIRQQLIELPYTGYTAIHRFVGKPDYNELNKLIAFDSGNTEPFFENETEYNSAIKNGFVKYDGYYTTIYADE